MGKDLKGKELGVGLSQLPSGKYMARLTKNDGKRIKKEFDKISECRAWYIEECSKHDEDGEFSGLTFSEWFDIWINDIKGMNIRVRTRLNYISKYNSCLSKKLGPMLMEDIRPLHCQKLLNDMADDHKKSTIQGIKVLMKMIFEDAVENKAIKSNPINRTVKANFGEPSDEREPLSKEEQRKFLEAIRGRTLQNQFSLALQTGLRVSEIAGLKWEDIDFTERVLHVRRKLDHIYEEDFFEVGDTKTAHGKRDIPLTVEAYSVLRRQKIKMSKQSVKNIEFADYVFLTSEGTPYKRSAYTMGLYRVCDRIGIRRISMHILRHTFATRCVEAGMKPKTLQTLMGHSKIEITMNYYVHASLEQKEEEIYKVSDALLAL